MLTSGKSSSGSRPLYWHIPHYTNQGSRPAGAMRDGRWKLVEHYDDGKVELFDLDADPGETETSRRRSRPAPPPCARGCVTGASQLTRRRTRRTRLGRRALQADLRGLRFDPVRSAARGRGRLEGRRGVAPADGCRDSTAEAVIPERASGRHPSHARDIQCRRQFLTRGS